MSSSSEPCRFFFNGGCSRGDRCLFSHERGATNPAARPNSAKRQQESGTEQLGGEKTKAECIYFLQGICTKGDQCPFSHGTTAVLPPHAFRGPLSSWQLHRAPVPAHLAHKNRGQPCRFFEQGRCSKGSACQFSHDISEVQGNHIPDMALRDEQACRFFAQGACSKGTSCPFRHNVCEVEDKPLLGDIVDGDIEDVTDMDLAGAAEVQACRFFLQGACSKGTSCPFRHDVSEDANQDIRSGDDERIDDVELAVVGKTKCVFGPGLHISAVRCHSEAPKGESSSTLLVNGLSSVISDLDIIRTLSARGEIAKVARKHEHYAYITFSHAEEAENAAEQLHGSTQLAWSTHGDPRHVVTATVLYGDGKRIRESATIIVQWYAPSRAAFVHFRSRHLAARVAAKCNKAVLNGRVISASFQKPTLRQRESFTAWFGNLSERTSVRDIKQLVREKCDEKTMSIDLQNAPFREVDGPKIVRRILERYSRNGQLASFEIFGATSGPKRRAIAKFLHAEEAASALEAIGALGKIEELGNSTMFAELQFAAKVVLRNPIYALFSDRLHAVLDEASDVSHRVYPSSTAAITTVRVFGKNCTKVSSLKAALERVAAGELLSDSDGLALWDPHLCESTLTALNGAEVYVDVDRRRKELRVFGDSAARARAKAQVEQLLREGDVREHALRIPRNAVAAVAAQGAQALKAAVGAASLELDLEARMILLEGGRKAVEMVRDVFRELKANEADVKARAEGAEAQGGSVREQFCPICLCEVDEDGKEGALEDATPPVQLACGHRFCGECVHGWLFHHPTFPVCCLAEGCGAAVRVQLLRVVVGGDRFQALLRKALDEFVSGNPERFQFCITPDCPQILDTARRVAQCSTCLVSACTACKVEEHEGQTCEEYRQAKAPPNRMRLRVIEDFLTLKCPRCRMAFVDFDGCFALTCGNAGCKAAFCGWCLADCGSDAHAHVRSCKTKPPGSDAYFGSFEQFCATHRRRQAQDVKQFLDGLGAGEREDAVAALQHELEDLGLGLAG